MVAAVGADEFVGRQEILVGHRGEVVDDDLVRLFLSVRRVVIVKAALALDFFDVVLEERRAFVVRLQVTK